MTGRARLVVAAVVAAFPAMLVVASAPATQAPELREGRALYVAHCASCHGVDALGGAQGPSLAGAGAASLDFMMSTGRMPLADPAQQANRQRPELTPDEISAITQYVLSIVAPGEPIPFVEPDAGDLQRGRELYSFNCLACHGPAGSGGAIGGGQIAPSLDEATPTQVAEAIRIGPGTMPRFGADSISDDEMNSLTRYVLTLRATEADGGADLGHVGPVAEGFIAWFVGLGIVLIVLRLSGSRS